jgi:hypothetical protein
MFHSFIVDTTGEITNVKVGKGVDALPDVEALRVIKI